jgi:ribosome modulation factor
MTGPMVERVARGAHQAVDRVADTASSAVERMRSGLSTASSTMGGKIDALSSTRSQWLDGWRESVRERPLAALGIGLAAGWLIARLMSSSSSDQ